MEQVGFSEKTIRFGVFEVDLATAELRKHGTRLRLQEQPFKVLAALLEQRGGVVLREDLVHRLWPDGTIVDFDRGLNAAVTRLRQVLGDSAENPRYVETVARRGYRFLAEIASVPEEIEPSPPQLQPAKSNWSGWFALVAAALLLTFIAILLSSRTHLENTLEQITRDPGLSTDPAISPDGKLLAYASDRSGQNLNIWIKQLVGGGESLQLTHDDSDAHQPSFSPDGSRIVYRSERDGGGVYAIPAIGGEAQLLAREGRDPRFSPDGRWIAYWVGQVSGSAPAADAAGTIYIIPSSGGEPKRLGEGLPGARAGYPVWSSDSKQLLVYANPKVGASALDADWWTVPMDGGVARKTGTFGRLQSQGFSLPFAAGLPRASAWVDNAVTFSAQKGDGRNIWRVRLSDRDGSVAGIAERLTQGTTLEVDPAFTAQSPLVFASLTQRLAIWSLPIIADEGKITGELQRLTEGSAQEVTPAISVDGRMLIYGSALSSHEDIWLKDLQTGKETAIASTAAAEWHPLISRDRSMFAYTSGENKVGGIYVVPAAGGKPRNVAQGSCWIFDWTPDNRGLLFHAETADPILKHVDLQSGTVSNYLAKPGFHLYQSKFSPDGEWVVVEAVIGTRSASNSDSRLFLAKIENGVPAPEQEWILASDEHGWSDKPRWSPDGKTLYYLSDRDGFRCLWAQRLDPATKHPISAPFPIHHFHKSRLSPSNVGLSLLEIDVAKDKIVMNLGELTGNIWSLTR